MVSLSLWLLAGWEDVLRMVAGQPGVSPLPAVEEERGAGTSHAACTVSLQEEIERSLKNNKS